MSQALAHVARQPLFVRLSVCLSACLCMPGDKPLLYSTLQTCEWAPVARSDLCWSMFTCSQAIITTSPIGLINLTHEHRCINRVSFIQWTRANFDPLQNRNLQNYCMIFAVFDVSFTVCRRYHRYIDKCTNVCQYIINVTRKITDLKQQWYILPKSR